MSTASRICSNTWPSRAPRAATRGRSPRRSRRSAAISMRRPASRPRPITRACSRPTCRSRSTFSPTFCPIPRSRRTSWRASRTSFCRRSAPARTRRTIWCSNSCRGSLSPINRSAVRSSARRRKRAVIQRRAFAGLSQAQLLRSRHGGGGDRGDRARRNRGRGGTAVRPFQRSGGADTAAGALSRRRADRAARPRAGAYRDRVRRVAAKAIPVSTACRCSPACWAAGCLRGCSRKRARSAACAMRSTAFHAPYSDTGMFGLYAGTDAEDLDELMRVVVGEIAATAADLTEAEVARAKAQMKAGLLMALESSGRAGRADRAPDDRLWPADPARRDRRQGRGGDGRRARARRAAP